MGESFLQTQRKQRRRKQIVLLLVGLLLLVQFGWLVWHLVSREANAGGAWRPSAGTALPVYFMSGIRGRLSPCVCDGEMAGGMAFRAGYLRNHPAGLQLDLGNVPSGLTDAELERAEDILGLLRESGCAAINVAATELRAGEAYLRGNSGQYVSCNVRSARGFAVVREYAAVRVAGVPVTVGGVTFATAASALRVMPPAEALALSLPRWPDGVRVLLVDGSREEAVRLAEDFPELALILFRGTGESLAPERVNRSWLASIYEGRYLGRLQLRWPEPQQPPLADGEAVLLNRANAVVAGAAGFAPGAGLPGVEVTPRELRVKGFAAGEAAELKIWIGNRRASAVQVERILSTCACVVLKTDRLRLEPGQTGAIAVQVKSLGLKGEQEFPVYFELLGDGQRGVASVMVKTTEQP